jgi:hypothetical protein
VAGRLRGIPWTNLVGVVESGDSIFKTSSAVAFDAGADTRGVLGFAGDCYLEFRAPGIVQAVMGFSDSTGVSAGISDLQFGLYANQDHFVAVESGGIVYDGGAASHTPGQILRVERSGSSVLYKRNGATQRTSALTAAQASAIWYVDLTIVNKLDALVGWQVWTSDPEPAWITVAKETGAQIYDLLTIGFPSGTRRYTTAGAPLAVTGEGIYEPKVTDWGGPLSFASGSRTCALQLTEWTVEFEDVDRTLAKIFGSGECWQNAPVLYQLGGPTIAAANRSTEFAGWLKGPPVCSGPFRYRLTFSNMPPSLSSPFLRSTLSRQDYSAISQAAIGQVPPLIYGRHYSEGAVDVAGGMLPAPKVQNWDGSSAVFLSGYGIPSLQMVYKDKVAQVSGGWLASIVLVNGRYLSQFSVSADPADSEWTIDANGFDWNADGTGVLIEHCVDILKHILTNFILPDTPWMNGAWLQPDPTLIDLPSFADAKRFLNRKAGARFIDGQQTGLQVINDWCQTFQIQAYITPKGKIGLVVQTPADTANDLYDAPTIGQVDAGDIVPQWPTDGQAKRVTAGFLFSGTERRPLATHSIYDPNISQEGTVALSLPFTPSLTIGPPTSLPNLKAWWNALAQRQLYNDGDAISFVFDTSNAQQNLSQATGAKQPIFRYDPIERRAWFSFDGVNDQLDSGLALSNFKTASAWTMLVAFRVKAFASGGGIWSDLLRCELYTTGGGAVQFRHDDGTADSVNGAVQGNLWYVACCRHVGGSIYLGINDARLLQMPSAVSGNTASLASNVSLGEGSGGIFGNVDIAEVIVFSDDKGEATRRLMAWMLSRHVYRYSSSVDTAKDAMSRYLNLNGRPAMRWTVNVPPDYWHKEAGQVVKTQHPAGPSYLPGWGVESWSARPGRILTPSWNPTTRQRQFLLEDAKLTSAGWWDTGEQQLIDMGKVDVLRREGRARLLDEIFSRPSYTWAEVPNAGGLVIELVKQDTEQGELRGVLIQQGSVNYLKRSSNINGVAGIAPGSLNGTGVNGSSITDGGALISGLQTDPFPLSYFLVAGNPHTTDLYIRLPDTDSIPNTNPLWVSIVLRNRADLSLAGEIVWRLQRLADSQFWNNATPGWQAGTVWNSTGQQGFGRFFSRKITAHSGSSAFRFDYGLKSGGLAGRGADIAFAGLSTGTVHTHSLVANDSGANTVHQPTVTDEYRVDCPNGVGFSLSRGSMAFRVVAGFVFADTTQQIGIVTHLGGGGAFTCYFDPASGWKFTYNGSTVTITGVPAVSRYDFVDIALRWTSALGELGLTSTITLFVRVNGGTWFSGSTAMTPTTDGAAQAFFLGGTLTQRTSLWFSRCRSWLIPLADSELKNWFGS